MGEFRKAMVSSGKEKCCHRSTGKLYLLASSEFESDQPMILQKIEYLTRSTFLNCQIGFETV
jgi:hypothetical protein